MFGSRDRTSLSRKLVPPLAVLHVQGRRLYGYTLIDRHAPSLRHGGSARAQAGAAPPKAVAASSASLRDKPRPLVPDRLAAYPFG